MFENSVFEQKIPAHSNYKRIFKRVNTLPYHIKITGGFTYHDALRTKKNIYRIQGALKKLKMKENKLGTRAA